ncbi:MAG: sulfate ABC transporter permease subunit [Polyangiales bacterium]
MQWVELRHEGAAPLPSTVRRVSRLWLSVGRWALTAFVLVYFATVLLSPIGALAVETARVGVARAVTAVFATGALAALRMSFILVVVAVGINAVIGTYGAIAIVRHRFVGRHLVSALCDLPLAVSPVMVGLGFLLLVGRDGAFSPALETIGLKVLFSFPGLVIATLFVTLPYTVREVVYVLDEIGTSEEEAAVTLGASPWQTFWRVTLPNVRLGLGYGLLMTIARTLGEFGAVLVLGGSISGQTQTATTFIHDAIEERELAGAYGMAAVLAIASVALLLILERAKRRRHAQSAFRKSP